MIGIILSYHVYVYFCSLYPCIAAYGKWAYNIFVLLTPLCTIYITCLLHNINVEKQKTDNYFENITRYYEKIDDNFFQIKNKRNNAYNIGEDTEGLKQRNKMYCILLRHYLKRFPDKNCPIDKLDLILTHIFFEPDKLDYHDKLKHEFESFCLDINNKELRPVSTIKKGGDIRYIQE